MFSLITTVFLTLRLPDPAQAEQWKTWALAVGIMVPVAPYEVYCIFPINDRVKEMIKILRNVEMRTDLRGSWGSCLRSGSSGTV